MEYVLLAKELCAILDKNFAHLISGGFEDIHALYMDNLYRKNQLVKFKKGNRVFEARVKKVSASGALIIQHAIEEEISFGEVEWLINQPS